MNAPTSSLRPVFCDIRAMGTMSASTVRAAQLAEIGVVLLMFTLGIEFSLGELRHLWRTALLGGGIHHRIGHHGEPGVISHHPEGVDPCAPVVDVGEDPCRRLHEDAVFDQLLPGVVARAEPVPAQETRR